MSLSNLRQDICCRPVLCADCPAHYYADQKTQIVLFVVQFALFGLLANRVRRRLAAVHDRVRRLALIVVESDVDDVVVEGATEVHPDVVEEPQIRV
jgi:hypothetical protein